MPQVFSPPQVLRLKLAFAGLFFILAAAWLTFYKSLPAQGGEVSPRQPIPFSHKHHAGDDGIDCRYCHYSVEKSGFAGIPSTQVCMTCHSQLFSDAALLAPLRDSALTGRPLAWVRVHRLPDFVFFRHDIHLAKGVGCVECHGQVDRMPRIRRVHSLLMQWCLDSHRNPAPHLRPRSELFDMASEPPQGEAAQQALAESYHLLPRQRMTDCSTCHR